MKYGDLLEYLKSKGKINENIIRLVKDINGITINNSQSTTEFQVSKIPIEEILLSKGFCTQEDIFDYYELLNNENSKSSLEYRKLDKRILKFLELDKEVFNKKNLVIKENINDVSKEVIKIKDLSAVLVHLNPKKIKEVIKQDEFYRDLFTNKMKIKSKEDLTFILTNKPYITRLFQSLSISAKSEKTLPIYMLNTKDYLYFLVEPQKTYKNIIKLTTKLNDTTTIQQSEELISKGFFKKWLLLILRYSLEIGVSDIHIEPDENFYTIRIRKDGILQYLCSIKKDYEILSLILSSTSQNDQEGWKPLDGQLDFLHPILGVTNVRWAENKTIYGSHIVMRLLPSGINAMTLDQINYSKRNLAIIRNKILKQPNGIILITGPTGSGKTNTLSAILREISKLENKVLSVEDPVEIKMPLIQQIQVNNKNFLTVHAALKSFLRQDPDIIFIGEIRDKEMATKAIEGAMTGHLMFATLHTNDSVSAIMRLIDIGIEPIHISTTLRAVIAQRLLRVLCPECKKRINEKDMEKSKVYQEFGITDNGNIYEHQGCPKCNFTGYSGRTPVAEIFVIDKKIQDMILERRSLSEIIEVIKENGFLTLQGEGIRLLEKGITDIHEIVRVLGNSEKELEFNYLDYEIDDE